MQLHHRTGSDLLTGLLSLALAGRFAGLTPHRHTVLQELQVPVLPPTLRSNLFHLWSPQHHTHIFIVQHTYDTHNFKINAPSVLSSLSDTPVTCCKTKKSVKSPRVTYCNSLIMCCPKVVLIFKIYVPATNTSQHWVIHCFDISSKIWTKINTLLKHYFQKKYIYVHTHTYLRCESTARSEATVTNMRVDVTPQWCKTPISTSTSAARIKGYEKLKEKWTVFYTLFLSHFHS